MAKKEEFDFYSMTSLKSYNLDESMRYQLNMLDSLDVFTRKHSENVANITCRMCKYLNCSTKFIVYCTTCAYLHDIGKMFIPQNILQKNGPLTDEEFEVMKKHTSIGYTMCMKDLKLRPYANGAKYHHECLDGSGYPEGFTKENIPIEGQIIKIADEYDAIVSKRQYKSHVEISETLRLMLEESKPSGNNKYGKLNPKLLKCLFKVVIDDIEYEMFCISEYSDYLKENIARLQEIAKYEDKMNKAQKDKDKKFYEEGMNILLTKNENLKNYKQVLQEYKLALESRNNHIKKLESEIKTIKKLK